MCQNRHVQNQNFRAIVQNLVEWCLYQQSPRYLPQEWYAQVPPLVAEFGWRLHLCVRDNRQRRAELNQQTLVIDNAQFLGNKYL